MARKKKKNPAHLTQRQWQSQQIMRAKKARKTRKAIVRRVQIAAAVLLAIAAVSGSAWMWHTSAPSRALQAMSDGVYNLTARAGFTLRALYLDGRRRTPMEDIEKALAVKKGDPILKLSLSELRERLEQVGSIQFASVERELPGTLYVHIVEREPVAIWQNAGKLALVDDKGVVMRGLDIASYRRLPLIVGADAPKHVSEMLSILSAEPKLAERFEAAVRVGGRRWNILLKKDVEVRLPEANPVLAWKSLAGIQTNQQVLDRDVKVIDLRLPDRLFIKLNTEDTPPAAENAKET